MKKYFILKQQIDNKHDLFIRAFALIHGLIFVKKKPSCHRGGSWQWS